jgi:hypothetical protein
MEPSSEQVITTGSLEAPTHSLENARPGTEAGSKRVQTTKESKSFSAALILGLTQSDLADLQANGLKVVMLARDGKVYISIEYPGHELSLPDTGKAYFLLDGKPVTEYE